MTTYPNYTPEITDADTTSWVDIVAPIAGRADLIQALRFSYFIENFQTAEIPFGMEFSLTNAAGVDRTFHVEPLPPNTGMIEIDVMPILSNLAAYGISNPHKVRVRMTATLGVNDYIRFYGFGIRGLDD